MLLQPLLPPPQTNVTPVLKSVLSACAELLTPGSFSASQLHFYFRGELFAPHLTELLLPSLCSWLQPSPFRPALDIPPGSFTRDIHLLTLTGELWRLRPQEGSRGQPSEHRADGTARRPQGPAPSEAGDPGQPWVLVPAVPPFPDFRAPGDGCDARPLPGDGLGSPEPDSEPGRTRRAEPTKSKGGTILRGSGRRQSSSQRRVRPNRCVEEAAASSPPLRSQTPNRRSRGGLKRPTRSQQRASAQGVTPNLRLLLQQTSRAPAPLPTPRTRRGGTTQVRRETEHAGGTAGLSARPASPTCESTAGSGLNKHRLPAAIQPPPCRFGRRREGRAVSATFPRVSARV